MFEIVKSELVVPSEETPKTSLWLSNLDLAASRRYTPIVYFYPSNQSPNFFSVKTLKSSLAKALVPFYPFAGRIGLSPDGRIEINCNGEGALVIVARSDAMLNDFSDLMPSLEMRNLFVPPTESVEPPCILLMVQVTFFKCGGVALGTAMPHTVVDGRSAFHFIETWSSITQGESINLSPPFLDRTLLRARPNPSVLYNHPEYNPNPTLVNVDFSIGKQFVVSIVKVSTKHVNTLKLRCGGAVSRFRAIVSLVWRCVCLARKLDSNVQTRISTMIDIRGRMNPPLPSTYFGNGVIRSSVSSLAGDVISKPNSYVAKRIYNATNQGDEYVKSVIHHLETANMSTLTINGLPTSDLQVVSWLGMPIYNADFGWGEPTTVLPAKLSYSGYIFLMDSPPKDASVSIVISLEPEIMEEFKKIFFEELAGLEADQ